LLESAGLRGRVMRLPKGHDPDSFLRAQGLDAFRTMLANAQGLIDFIIDDAADHATDVASRARAIQSLGPVLARVESPVERRAYVERVARRFDIRDVDLVRQELTRGVRAGRSEGRPLAARGSAAAAETVSRPTPTPVRRPQDLPGKQCEVLGALLDSPALFSAPEAQGLDGLLTDPDLQAIFRFTARLVEIGGVIDAPALLEGMSSNPARAWLSKRLSESPLLTPEQAKSVIESAIPWLVRDRKQAQAKALKKQIDAAMRGGDMELAHKLTRDRDEVLKS
jgi:DNA primase